jgi:hypothetical protein
MLSPDGEAAALAFRWLAAVADGFELAIVTEHFDESLLLLGKEMGWPAQDLIYLSQVRCSHPRSRVRAFQTFPRGIGCSKTSSIYSRYAAGC